MDLFHGELALVVKVVVSKIFQKFISCMTYDTCSELFGGKIKPLVHRLPSFRIPVQDSSTLHPAELAGLEALGL